MLRSHGPSGVLFKREVEMVLLTNKVRVAVEVGIAAALIAAGSVAGAPGGPLILGMVNDAGTQETGVTAAAGEGAAFSALNSSSENARGIVAAATSSDGQGIGVLGSTFSNSNPFAAGVVGQALGSSGSASGVIGTTSLADGVGVYGINSVESNTFGAGVHGDSGGPGPGVYGSTGGNGPGVQASSGRGDHLVAGPLGSVPVFRVANNGDAFSNGTFHCSAFAPSACVMSPLPTDFAEVLPAKPGLLPGDVLVIGSDGKLAKSRSANQTNLIGVCSSSSGFVAGGASLGQAGFASVSILGVVAVKASAGNGAIRPGDLLVTSKTPGAVMRAGKNAPTGAILGRALTSLASGTGSIQVVLSGQ